MPKAERAYLSVSVLAVANILTVTGIVTLTIVGEVIPPFKDFLTQLTGHHWITKGLAALAIFTISTGIGAAVRREEPADPALWSWLTSGAALAGALVLFLFFIGRFVAH